MKRTTRLTRKTFAALLALVLVFGAAIGGTMAWLMDETEAVKNTFTYGDISIDLTETTGTEYLILPGNDLTKDPMVTVEAGSEASWLFVKIEEMNWPAFTEADESTRKVDYGLAAGWQELTPGTGIFYREVDAVTIDTEFAVLLNDKIIVSDTLTKDEVSSVTELPSLTFTAYAVQRDGVNLTTATDAWAVANP